MGRAGAHLHLRLLGGFEARVGGAEHPAVLPRKGQALLAYLALPLGRTHPRDKLATLLWGDHEDEQSRNSLRQVVFGLRRALGSGQASLVAKADTLSLDPHGVEVDVSRFETLGAATTPAAWREAGGLYGGDLLEGLRVAEPVFDTWLSAERERLHERAVETLWRLLGHEMKQAPSEVALATALRLLSLNPFQEPVHRAVMRLYLRLGRRADSLRQYHTCVEILRQQLGVDPEPETHRLYQQVLDAGDVPPLVPRHAAESAPVDPSTATSREVHPPGGGRRHAGSLQHVPLVGRDAEVTRMREELTDAWAGRGRILVILGEAGIGKTRMLAELAREAERQGGATLLGRAHESEQILPFGPWVSALRDAGALSDPQALERLESVWRTELARLFPELAKPSRLSPEDPAEPSRLFEALIRLLRYLVLGRPLVVMLEDCQWADAMTLRFLAFSARRLRSAPILVILTAREEELSDNPTLRATLEELAAEQLLTRLALERLSQEDTGTLVRLLDSGDDVAARTEQIWAASSGNPFMVTEVVRGLREGVPLEATAGLPVPAAVRDMIARRLDRLDPLGQQLVCVAATIGREFDFALLQAAAVLDPRQTAEGLEILVRRRVLRGSADRFDFTHDRIREVAYERMLPPHRRVLHAAVAGATETVFKANLDSYYATIAFHYREGEAWAKAVEYLRLGATQAMARGAYQEAAAGLDQALAAVEHLGSHPETLRSTLDLRIRLRNALLPLGDHARMLDNLREAEGLATRLDDPHGLGWVLSYSALEVWRTGDAERAIELARRILAIADTLEDTGLRVIAGIRLGQAHHSLGRYTQAIDALRTTIAADRGRDQYGLSAPPSIIARIWLGWSLAELGKFDEGEACTAEAAAIAEETSQPYPMVAAYFGVGLVHLKRGNLGWAIGVLERGLALCQDRSIPVFFAWIASSLAFACVADGQIHRGRGVGSSRVDLQACKLEYSIVSPK